MENVLRNVLTTIICVLIIFFGISGLFAFVAFDWSGANFAMWTPRERLGVVVLSLISGTFISVFLWRYR